MKKIVCIAICMATLSFAYNDSESNYSDKHYKDSSFNQQNKCKFNKNNMRRAKGQGHMGMMRGHFIEKLLNNPKAVQELGLSEEQVKNMKEELASLNKQQEKLIQELKTLTKKQIDLIKSDDTNEKTLLKTVDKTGKIRTKIAKINVKRIMLLKNNVDPQKLKELREKMQRRSKKRNRKQKDNSHGKIQSRDSN